MVERIYEHSKPTIILNERMGLQIGQLLSLRVVVSKVDYLIGLISVKRFSDDGNALCELDYLNIDSGLAEIIDNPMTVNNIIARVYISGDDLNQLKEVSQNDR
ncbi:hypothetical protein DK37_18455 [Halomonas sp. SUBG004]|nr:hypothetical protein DK37_18455 [Halomonas sp. SUBG004]